MEVLEFQKLCSTTVNKIDEKQSLKRDEQFLMSHIVEELGELAKEVNREKLRNEKAKKSDIESEFADVIIQLLNLAERYDVNIEKSVRNKIEILKEKHKIL